MEELKKSVRLNCIGRKLTDQFTIDEDINVPDAKADIEKIILSEGHIRLEDIRPVENYVRVSGKLVYQILYVSEDTQRLSSLQGKLPLEEMIYTEEEEKEAILLKSYITELTASAVHSRKLSLKALIELTLISQEEKEQELTLDAKDSDPLYKKYESRQILKLHSSKKDTYRIKEEMRLAGTKENIGTLLWTEVSQRKLDTRLEADGLSLRGELQVFCLYESQDGKTDFAEQTVPYEGRIDCGGADGSMYHHFYAELTDENIDVRMDEDGEMRIFGVEATLELRLSIYEEEDTKLLKDVYSLSKVCVPDFQEITMESLIMQNHSKYKLSEQLSLPELKDSMLQICHSGGYLEIEHTEIVPEGILAEGMLNICFLYIKADDKAPFDVWQGIVPFSYIIESNEIDKGMRYDITDTLEQVSVGLWGSGEVEVKAALAFHTFLRRPFKIFNITDIKTEPLDIEGLEKAPGIVGYTVKENDGLWDLAKRYHTTEEGIREVNHLEGKELKAGDKLLIFKENMGIL